MNIYPRPTGLNLPKIFNLMLQRGLDRKMPGKTRLKRFPQIFCNIKTTAFSGQSF
jgi:hypothetical protein